MPPLRRYGRALFGLAAAFNFAVGLALLFGRPFLSAPLKLDPVAGTNVVFASMVGAMVFLFGVSYAAVAIDPVKYRPFIGLGIVGKLMAIACAFIPWFLGIIPSAIPQLAGGDIVFAALFADYLRRTSHARLVTS